MCKRADPQLPLLFGKLPRCPYGVTPVPAAQAPAAPAAYYYEPADGCSRAGYYYVNVYDLPSRPSYLMESTTLHETVPGHHLQIALAQEMEGVPTFRKFSGWTAYIEGWALYSESLGPRMGFYTDPYVRFGAYGAHATLPATPVPHIDPRCTQGTRSCARAAWWWTRACTR